MFDAVGAQPDPPATTHHERDNHESIKPQPTSQDPGSCYRYRRHRRSLRIRSDDCGAGDQLIQPVHNGDHSRQYI